MRGNWRRPLGLVVRPRRPAKASRAAPRAHAAIRSWRGGRADARGEKRSALLLRASVRSRPTKSAASTFPRAWRACTYMWIQLRTDGD